MKIKESANEISFAIVFVSVVKMAFIGLTLADSITILAMLACCQISRIIDYKYPERPDLYALTEKHDTKLDRLESEVTALKLGEAFRK